MKAGLYFIYDTVAQDRAPVFQAKNDTVAIRGFKNAMKGVPYPNEFELHCIALIEYNDEKQSYTTIKPDMRKLEYDVDLEEDKDEKPE